MNRKTLFHGMGAAAVLFAVAACSNDSTSATAGLNTEIQATNRADAGEAAAMTVTQLAANEAYMGADVVNAGAAVSGVAVNCTGPDASGWYTCTAALENGLTITRQVRYWEGMSYGLHWNPGVTDSVNHAWSAAGTIDAIGRPGKVWTVDDAAAATMTLPAIAQGMMPQHSWTGTANRHQMSTYTVNSVERIFDHTAHDTLTAVVFQMPRMTNPFPLSGSIIRNVTTVFTAGSDTRTVTRRFVVTFNGTGVATLQDGALTCDLDLALRTVSNCH